METGTVDQQESTYSVIAYPAAQLPESYKNLLFSNWLRSLKKGNDYFKLIDNDAYYDVYHKYIEMLLLKPTTTVRLAVLSDDYDVVLAWAVVDGDVLHYVYTNKDYRRQGFATAVVPKSVTTITHLTRVGMAIWGAKLSHLKFNPFK